jgi:hypothetical protein
MVSYFVGDRSVESALILGDDPAHVSTIYVERCSLSIRMPNCRFTWLTNGFSKDFQSHVHTLALYFAFYNFVRVHKTLRISPAMAAGITDHLWSIGDVVARIDSAAPPAKTRGPYRKRAVST